MPRWNKEALSPSRGSKGASGSGKVLVVGPVKGGKSAVANNLYDYYTNTDGVPRTAGDYRPTAGVRILEFECPTQSAEMNVELWDCSGDTRYEACWPAMLKGAMGVVIVYNPESAGQCSELESWYEWFVKNPGMSKEKCIVFETRTGQEADAGMDAPRSMRGIKFVEVSVDVTEQLSREFEKFVGGL